VLAVARASAFDQRRDDRPRQLGRTVGERLAERHAYRRPVVVAREHQRPGGGPHGEVGGRPPRLRAILAERGERRMDQRWVQRF